MNIFLDYKKKFLKYLLSLKKKKIIDFPDDIKNLTVEISPKEQSSDMSCNVAMLLSKFNNKAPIDLADKLKEVLSLDEKTLKLMGIEGRKNVLKKFDVEKMCSSTITEYRKIIN